MATCRPHTGPKVLTGCARQCLWGATPTVGHLDHRRAVPACAGESEGQELALEQRSPTWLMTEASPWVRG